MDIEITKATETELCQIARLHKKIFKGHFLAQLPVFLLEKFYKEFLDRNSLFLIAKSNDEIYGFVMGGDSGLLSDAKNAFIKKNFISLSLYSLVNAISYLWKKLKQSNKYVPIGNMFSQSPSFRLLSIGVRVKGQGIASALLDAYENIIPNHIEAYGLSVHKSNGRAIAFYKKNGFQICGERGESYYLAKSLDREHH